MPFRFSLEPVLRLRRSQQRQLELALQKANDRVNGIVLELQQFENEALCITSAQESKPEISGAELYFDEQRRRILVIRRDAALQRLHEARERQALAAKQFQEIWQKREALEVLRRGEHEALAVEESRREQRAQDDLFLQRTHARRSLPSSMGKRCPSS